MKTHSIAAAIFACMAALPGVSLAATSKALSPATTVDTRVATIPTIHDDLQSDGRRFISLQTNSQALARDFLRSQSVYLTLQVPAFQSSGGGWGATQAGLGTFYGLEVQATEPLIFKDKIYFIPGGPPLQWKPTVFNGIINIPLAAGTYYFRIDLAPGTTSLNVSTRMLSARLCDKSGNPVTTMDATRPLWLLAHGKNDGEKSFRKMNSAVTTGTGDTQVVGVDWASGADGWGVDLTNGRYFINLGTNLAGLLKSKGIVRNKVHWVGHSWGTLVGYETASAFGGVVNRFVALDPATQAFGGYDDGRVKFSSVSMCSSGIRGGTGPYGSDTKANTCAFSVRLVSLSPLPPYYEWPLDSPFSDFYHSLPRDWFEKAISNNSDAYWPFFKGVLLRTPKSTTANPPMPWGVIYGNIDKFDMECYGTTSYDNNNALFLSHSYLLFKNTGGKLIEARATTNTGGGTDWTYQPH